MRESLLSILSSVLATSALWIFLLWLFREFILAKISGHISHGYDRSLEEFKSTLRKQEEHLKEEMRKRAEGISSLRKNILDTVGSNQSDIYKRRIEAVEDIWCVIVDLAQGKILATMMSNLNIEEIEKSIMVKNHDVSGVFQRLKGALGEFDPKKVPHERAILARPFVSPIAYSLYKAYSSIISHYQLQNAMLREGLSPSKYLNEREIVDLIDATMPHNSQFIQQNGLQSSYLLLDEIEKLLLSEFDRILKGEIDDKDNIRRAHRIDVAVRNLDKNNREAEQSDFLENKPSSKMN